MWFVDIKMKFKSIDRYPFTEVSTSDSRNDEAIQKRQNALSHSLNSAVDGFEPFQTSSYSED